MWPVDFRFGHSLSAGRLSATPAESEAPGAQNNKQFNKDIKKTAGKSKFFEFVDSLKPPVWWLLILI
ncbi:hypothetical protein CN481_00425 [Bacillus sp. AFS006103]|jgi:hypothetical protein|nr:hypothetical protein CN481_00425 [Bacillus sp. AFS006103]